jgi:hypothetical protein
MTIYNCEQYQRQLAEREAILNTRARLAAAQYLTDKKAQRESDLDSWFFMAMGFVLFCLFLTTAGADIHRGVFS